MALGSPMVNSSGVRMKGQFKANVAVLSSRLRMGTYGEATPDQASRRNRFRVAVLDFPKD